VALEHVEAKQQVHRLPFQNRESHGKEEVSESNLSRVNATEDFCRSHALGNTSEPLVNQAHDSTRFRTLGGDYKLDNHAGGRGLTDGGLRS